MKIPTLKQLQAWSAQWDQAKRYLSYQKVFDQRLQPSQPASDTEEVNQVGQDELGQDPTGVELINDGVDQDEAQDQQAKKINNTQRAKVFKLIADKHILLLYEELGPAFEALGLEPPWSATNSASGMYRTDEHLVPLSIRMLDGLRQSELSGYEDFSEPDHEYGCTSPISHILMEKNESPEDEITNNRYNEKLDKKLDKYVDELAERLTNFRANLNEKWTGHLPDTVTLKSRVLRDMKALVDNRNAKSLFDIEKEVEQKTYELIGQFLAEDSPQLLPHGANLDLDSYRGDINQVFKRFNREKNAERHLRNCFDLAFCAKASESDQSAAHLQAMKDNGVTDIPGVLRDASVDSAQSLYDFTGLSVPELIKTTKRAVKISSYGLLKATLDVIKARNVHITASDWRYMMDDALNRCEPSIIKQCLHIKNKSQRSWLEHFNQNDPVLMRDLLMRSIDMDKYYGKLRSNDYRLQILLDSEVNVNVNVEDTYGNTALISAASIGGFESAVNQLIKAGADVNAKNKRGETALICASMNEHEEVVEELIKARANIYARNNGGVTALMMACDRGHERVVSKLCAAGVDINAKDNTGLTALMIACERGKTVVVEHLLKAIKIDIKAKNEKGETALMYASRGERIAWMRASHEGHETIVEKLITAGADINAKSKDGDTALMMACQRQNEKIVSALITAGADIEAKNEKGETALIIACQTDKLKIVSALMRAGADVFNRGPGKFPSQYANESSNENITNLVNLERQRRIDRISQMQRASREASTASNTNATTQALTELTTAATEIDHQTRPGPSL